VSPLSGEGAQLRIGGSKIGLGADWRRLGGQCREAVVHLVLTAVVYRLAFELRFDFATLPTDVRLFWMSLPLLVALRLSMYAMTGVFRAYLLHFGVQDLFTLAQAVTLSTGLFVMTLMLLDMLPGVPRSVILIEWAGAIFAAAGVPFVARSLREAPIPFVRPRGRRTVVLGSGQRAEQLLREVRREPGHALHVVGLVDLDGTQLGRAIRGVRVVGAVSDLPALATGLGAEFAIIALEQNDGSEMRRVVDQCIAAGLEFKTLPSLSELLEDTAGVRQLRDVRIEDLLGRQPVSLDLSRVEVDFQGRVILLTGAAGSIGSELARQIAVLRPARLILLDQAESDLYFVHLELQEAHPDLDLVPVICDITNPDRLGQVYAQHHPEYVVHAAAYKHVPLMETNVVEAVRNNVMGTLIVATTAARHQARRVLLVSTDKAINPSSVMGATKRVAERIVFGLPSLCRSKTEFRAVRFGNVLASNGSVIPLFERQLAVGGPLTVTHPDVERYFMTIQEAVQLVLQAGSLPETAGSIAMLEMGQPVRILDLAEKLIRFAGRVPGKDVQIVFTGLRPGEKLTEDLVSALEDTVPTSSAKIRISHTVENGGTELEERLSRLMSYLELGDREGLLATLCELVPECVAPLDVWRQNPAALLTGPRVFEHQNGAATNGHADLWNGRHPGDRFSPALGLRVADRREGVSCRRRSTSKRGGRRRTDAWHSNGGGIAVAVPSRQPTN
jgi:FlaA1/EpsC-like NDP-sugar epimerase